jgi:ribonuclease HII
MWSLELDYHRRGILRVAGLDEAGRGSLCGPVVAAAFIARPNIDLPKVADSKRLTAARRDQLYRELLDSAEDYSVGIASPREVDELNVLQATMLAMERSLRALRVVPEILLVDGNRLPGAPCPSRAIVGGDASVGSIAAASILAKVTRDFLMVRIHHRYPDYGFAANKGYGTPEHHEALKLCGPCPLHRKSFGSVRQPKLML